MKYYDKFTIALASIFICFSTAQAETIDLLSEERVVEQPEYSEQSDQDIVRKDYDLRSIQEAFNKSKLTDNVVSFTYSSNKIYKVKLRLHMNTLVYLPEGEEILAYTLGDDFSFKIKNFGEKIPNLLSVRSDYSGVDTNLSVISKSGKSYSFYLRSYPVKAKVLPDFKLYVKFPKNKSFQFVNDKKLKQKPSSRTKKEKEKLKILAEIKQGNDYLRHLEDPQEINIEYTMRGSKDIAPYAVYDDRRWTYFDFRKNFVSDRLPVIYKVIDGYDTIVNTRMENGFLIAESLSMEGWTLRNGKKYVCVKSTVDLQKKYSKQKLKKKKRFFFF